MISIPGVFFYKIQNTFENYPEFRLAIRENIYNNLIQVLHINPTKSDILDLSRPPKLNECGLSISHTKNFGSFVLSLDELHIGLDIEESQRIQKEPLLRVSSLAELEQAPSFGHLWTAKEAAFKSFYKLKAPKVLAEIEITDWKLRSGCLFTFSYFFNNSSELPQCGTGYSWQEKCLNMSFCTISS